MRDVSNIKLIITDCELYTLQYAEGFSSGKRKEIQKLIKTGKILFSKCLKNTYIGYNNVSQ